MPEPVLKAVLIGAGRMGWGYDRGQPVDGVCVSQAACLVQHPRTELVGIVEPNAAVQSEIRETAHARGMTPPRLDASLDLLAQMTPDLVCIASPTAHHAAHLEAALDCAPSHIWLEKPATHDRASLDAALSRLLRMPRPPRILVNYMRRMLPQVQQLRTLVREAAMGRVVSVEARYSRKLDVNGVHMLDLVCFVLDLQSAPNFDWHRRDAENPSFGFSAAGASVSVLGRDLPYHLIELDVIFEGGRARLSRGGLEASLERSQPNPDYPGFYLLAPPVPLVDGAAAAMRNATYSALCHLLSDETLESPLGMSKVTQVLTERALST